MACVYILYSEKLDKFYIGSSKELLFRIEQHFNKEIENGFTTKSDDWKLFFSVENLEYKQARGIEAHIKKMKSSVYIRNFKKHSEIVEKLKLKYKKD